MQADHVGLPHQLIERNVTKVEQLAVKRMRLFIIGNHSHAKTNPNPDDVESNPASSDDPERLASQVKSSQTLAGETPGPHGLLRISRHLESARIKANACSATVFSP